MNRHHRVLLVGAGPAGGALALVLARAGVSVLLVEQSRFEQTRVGELLSPDGVHILSQMLPGLSEQHLKFPLSVASSWRDTELTNEQDGSELPWRAIDRVGLDRRLAEEAEAQGAVLRIGARIRNPVRQGGRWRVTLESDSGCEELTTDFLVDATGRSAMLAKQFGAIRMRQSGQVALVGFLTSATSVEVPKEMVLETTSEGWWYAAPIMAGSAVAVFVTDNDLDKGPPEEAWQRAFDSSAHVGPRFAEFALRERPRRVPADSSLLLPSFGEGWMAVGDAASCFDPLSIHGIGRALLQGAKVGNFLVDSYARGVSPNPVRLIEENGEEFLKEVLALSAWYRTVKQWPESPFWQRRERGYPSSEIGQQKRPPRKVAVTWGRGINWPEYSAMEAELLASEDLESLLRKRRWSLCLWASQPRETAEVLVAESLPTTFLTWLENLLVGALLCCLENAPTTDASALFRQLIDDDSVHFARVGWQGRFSELAESPRLSDIDWLKQEATQYQHTLINRKFLLTRTPLLHNLCLLSVLPSFLLTYSLLLSLHRGANQIERQDYLQALEIADKELVANERLDQLPHAIVGFHLDKALEIGKKRHH